MKQYIITILLSVSVFSCAKKEIKVMHVTKPTKNTDLKNVKIVNEEDPNCNMKTTEFLKDTAVYKGKIYGFCSDYCKKEFKKAPEKYTQK